MAQLPWRLFRPAPQPSHADQHAECGWPRPGMGLSDQPACANQVFPAACRRNPLLHCSGHMLWHYNHPTPDGQHIGHRGLAMYKGWLYFTTPDAHLVCLNAKDGTRRWDKVIADVKVGYWSTMAPLVVRDHVI